MSVLVRIYVTLSLSSLFVVDHEAAVTTTQSTTTSTTSSSSGAATRTVIVGAGGDYQFQPNSITANPGDTVSFQFYSTNHSVIRGEYTGSEACWSDGCNPCVPIELTDTTVTPFASRNFAVQDVSNPDNLDVCHRRSYPIN
jgi:plastocyanin